MIKITWKHRFAAMGIGLLSAIIILFAGEGPRWAALMTFIIVEELTLIKVRLGMMETES